MGSNISPLSRSANSLARKSQSGLKVILFIILIGLVGGAAYAGYIYFKFDGMLDQASAPNKQELPIPKEQSAKLNPKTILLLGLDTRERTGTLNTDVIMVATLNPTRKSATIVSIPRDTYLQPEGYKGRKANSFYSITQRSNLNPEQKEEEIKRIFGEYLKIPIDYLSIIHFKTFEDVVDQLGGIMVDVDMDMRYVDSVDGTNINLQKGYQELDGKKALDFVRYRQSNRGTGGSSDFQRNERQQRVIAAIVDQLKSVGGTLKLGGIFDALGDNIATDIPKEQMKNFLMGYIGITNEHIEYIPLAAVWKSPYSYPDPLGLETAQEALQAQLK